MDKIEKNITECFVDLLKGVAGIKNPNITPYIEGIEASINLLISLRDRLFFAKFKRFINGFETNEESIMFANMLETYGNKTENTMRLMRLIENADSERKIDIMLNLSRAYGQGQLNRIQYFNSMQTVCDLFDEEITYLANKLTAQLFEEDEYTDNLLKKGIVRQANSMYSFSKLAYTIVYKGIMWGEHLELPEFDDFKPRMTEIELLNEDEIKSLIEDQTIFSKDVPTNIPKGKTWCTYE